MVQDPFWRSPIAQARQEFANAQYQDYLRRGGTNAGWADFAKANTNKSGVIPEEAFSSMSSGTTPGVLPAAPAVPVAPAGPGVGGRGRAWTNPIPPGTPPVEGYSPGAAGMQQAAQQRIDINQPSPSFSAGGPGLETAAQARVPGMRLGANRLSTQRPGNVPKQRPQDVSVAANPAYERKF